MSNEFIELCEPKENNKYKSSFYKVCYMSNGKIKEAKFSIEKYGKYAKNLAEHAFNNGERLLNWYEEIDDYVVIYTYNKKDDKYGEIKVDKDDFDRLEMKKYYWAIEKSRNEYYAVTRVTQDNGNSKRLLMHRFIMNPSSDNEKVDHIKGNGLDNRRNNLRIVTSQQNSMNRVNLNSNNKTGVIGVHRSSTKGAEYYAATWNDDKGQKHQKQFGINRYGEDEAFRLACEYRQKMMNKYYQIK